MTDAELVHLAVLGEQQGICGGTGGTFTVSEQKATCEDCLHENEAIQYGGTFADDAGGTYSGWPG